ncbi:DUF3883 domain-containing protein [Ruegeria sp.]|uniref:DUF3883 domain-containing protein n=1 Tax=Ruegeria sp. TaxID=1879320 RepID=UPI003C7D3D26
MIELLLAQSGTLSVEQLISGFAALEPVSRSRTRNTILKLLHYKIADLEHDDKVALTHDAKTDWWAAIASQVAVDLAERLTLAKAWSCMMLDSVSGSLQIDAMTLPMTNDGFSNWVVEFGVAKRQSTSTRYWTVSERYTSNFLSAASIENDRRPPRAKSVVELDAQLERQRQLGDEAEDWVLQFERARLASHPLQSQIRKISSEDVSAGYDIVSFSSPTSLTHDLFIEVKSHGSRKLFHWSRNEIATALEFGEAYALYLVDRTKCNEPSYKPHIILAPSPELFSRLGSGWTVEATSFEFQST